MVMKMLKEMIHEVKSRKENEKIQIYDLKDHTQGHLGRQVFRKVLWYLYCEET